MKKFINVLIPLLLLGIGISFIFVFEFYLKDKIQSVQVLVASTDIGFKEEFTSENIQLISVHKDQVIEGAITTQNDIDYVLSNYAAIEIKKGTQLYKELVDEYNLVPDDSKGEMIAPIPNRWIYSVSGSLRRGFIADLYLVPPDSNIDEKLIKQLVEAQKVNEDEQGEEEENEESSSSPIRLRTSNGQEDELSTLLSKPVLSSVRVAYAKDNSNKEVRQSEEGYELDATGVISQLEIIATREELSLLRSFMDKGYRLYITYTFERGADKE